jgi:hypothetical protein
MRPTCSSVDTANGRWHGSQRLPSPARLRADPKQSGPLECIRVGLLHLDLDSLRLGIGIFRQMHREHAVPEFGIEINFSVRSQTPRAADLQGCAAALGAGLVWGKDGTVVRVVLCFTLLSAMAASCLPARDLAGIADLAAAWRGWDCTARASGEPAEGLNSSRLGLLVERICRSASSQNSTSQPCGWPRRSQIR